MRFIHKIIDHIIDMFKSDISSLRLAIGCLLIWGISRFFPHLIMYIIRGSMVFLYDAITLYRGKSITKLIAGIAKLFLETNFPGVLRLLFNESEECIFCFIWGAASFVWVGIAVFLTLYELKKWHYFRKLQVNTYQ